MRASRLFPSHNPKSFAVITIQVEKRVVNDPKTNARTHSLDWLFSIEL
jgi:hypothetical protein